MDSKNTKINESVPQTGNASNPSPGSGENAAGQGIFDKKAEKYLRESANIEDMPDPDEDQDAIKDMQDQQD